MDTELDDSLSGRVMEYSYHSKFSFSSCPSSPDIHASITGNAKDDEGLFDCISTHADRGLHR